MAAVTLASGTHQSNKNSSSGGGNLRTAQYRTPGSGKAAARADEGMDLSLIFIVLFMLAFGLVMLYSASSYEAAVDYDGDGMYYLKRQALFIAVGLVLMVGVTFVPIRLIRRLSPAVFVFSIVLLLLLIPFGTAANGATRWLYVGPISIQPAEVSKTAVILATAALIAWVSDSVLRSRRIFLLLIPAVIEAVLIYVISSNLSSALIVLLIALAMLFTATDDVKRFVIPTLLLVGAAAAFVCIVLYTDWLDGFRAERILAWLDPTAYSDSTALQTLQGLYGIGSGGVFGKGLGQSIQKLGYIPEAQNDMIFSIICEELGLFGAISVIMLFVLLGWRILLVARNAGSLFQSFLVIGVLAHIMIQVLLNIAVVTNTIPNTGVTLPFFSYGGSAAVMLLIEIGLVLNVSRNTARRRREHARA